MESQQMVEGATDGTDDDKSEDQAQHRLSKKNRLIKKKQPIAKGDANKENIHHQQLMENSQDYLEENNFTGSYMQLLMTVVLRVGMPCEGCVGAVKRVLGKMEGVESFDVDIKEQKVTVKGNVTADAVLQTVSKTGKKTSFWEAQSAANQSSTPATAS